MDQVGDRAMTVGRLGAAAAVAAYAWWATSFRPFTSAALAATIGGGVAAVVVGTLWRGQRASVIGPDGRSGAQLWLVLIAALVAWELASFVQHPRAEHPTLSSLANEVLGHRPLRALAMVAWLTLGVRIARP